MSELEAIADRIRQHPKLVIADDYELAFQKTLNQGRQYHNGVLLLENRREELWVSLRILHRKRGGRATALNPNEKDLNTLVDKAFDAAQLSSVDPWFRFPIWKTLPAPTLKNSSFKDYSSLYEESFEGIAFTEHYEQKFTQTFLRRKTERQPRFFQGSSHWMGFVLEGIEEERSRANDLSDRSLWVTSVLSEARLQRETCGKSCGRGARPILLSPRAASRILNEASDWFHADRVHNGLSPLADPGFSLSESLSLVDEGGERSAGGMPFDLEGVATQRTVIAQKGKIASLLFDVHSATRENRLSTGNFLRAHGESHPRIGSSLLYVSPGTSSHEELTKRMGSGVYLESIHTLERLVGERTTYRVRGRGYRIALGEKVETLSDIHAHWDLLEVFRGVCEVGSNLEFFSSVGSPSILIREMPLGI